MRHHPLVPRLALPLLPVWLVLAAGAARAEESPPPPRPNVLLVLLDDVGFSDLGCYGGEIPTPNIDRLATGGVRFTQFYDSARCCPSRAALLTGLHPHQAGIGSFAHSPPRRDGPPSYRGALRDDCVTLAEVMRAAGYGTYMVGKWHVGVPPGPIERGFDEFYGFTRHYEADQWKPEKYRRLPEGRTPEIERAPGEFYATEVFADYALEFVRQGRARKKPWFLYLAHGAAHFPVQAPRETVAELVPVYVRGWDVLREERFARQIALGLANERWALSPRSLVPVDPVAEEYSGKPNPAWATLPADRRLDLAHRMAIFAAMLVHVDRGLGRILADLEAHHELENTLIVLLSDNGACYEWSPIGFDGPSRTRTHVLHTGDQLARMGGPGTYHAYGSGWANLGNTPFRLYKHFTHEGGIRTPCIVHWPAGIQRRGEWETQPGHVMDLLPTLASAAGVEVPGERDGRPLVPVEGVDLLPALRGGTLPARSLAFEHQAARALRDGRWKAVWGKRMPEDARWELYDLANDPCETHDLAAEHPQRVAEMAKAWEAWAHRVGVEGF